MAPYGNPPRTNARAWKAYEAFAAADRVALRIDEPAKLELHRKRLAARNTASPKLWMDADLAGFAIAAELRLVTTAVAFRQFAGVDRLSILAIPVGVEIAGAALIHEVLKAIRDGVGIGGDEAVARDIDAAVNLEKSIVAVGFVIAIEAE